MKNNSHYNAKKSMASYTDLLLLLYLFIKHQSPYGVPIHLVLQSKKNRSK